MGEIRMIKENYTTASKKAKDPVGEKDKVELSEEAFINAELQEMVLAELRRRN